MMELFRWRLPRGEPMQDKTGVREGSVTQG
jgi:hypothetical protein